MITIKEINKNELEAYGSIPFWYKTNKKYEIIKKNRGLEGLELKLVDCKEFYKDFGSRVDSWLKTFDLSNWYFFAAYDEDKMIGGATLATKTNNCHMLEKREDLALLWDLRISDEYKHQGIGTKLFNIVKEFATKKGFKELKVECQNTNPSAVNFYHKQGMHLDSINEHAYIDYPDEVQLLWYLDL